MAAKRLTKSQVISQIAEMSELDKKSVSRVFESLHELIRGQLSNRGPGEIIVPGLVKIKAVKKPAVKGGPSINPFTKEPMVRKAKPASKLVRATPLKPLKDMLN